MELYKLPRHEIDDAIAYYNEYFEEAGPEAEADVIRELGSPSRIATQIKADYAVRQLESMERGRPKENASGRPEADSGQNRDSGSQAPPQGRPPGKLSTAWWVVIGIVGGIFAAPIAIPVAIVLTVLVVGLFIGVVSILIAAVAGAVALIGVSIAAVILGYTLLAALVTSGLAAGDRVIVEGLQKVRPGAPAREVPFGQSAPAGTAAPTPASSK